MATSRRRPAGSALAVLLLTLLQGATHVGAATQGHRYGLAIRRRPAAAVVAGEPRERCQRWGLGIRGGDNAGNRFLAEFSRTVKDARHHLVAAAAARSTSIFVMYPVDTIKTRLQMGVGAFGGGIGQLYRGVAGSLVGQVPYGVLTFGSYEVYKEKLQHRFPSMALGPRSFIAAVMGDLTGSLWLCPSEVVKQMLQGGVHTDIASAVRHIATTKGLPGFYQGYVSQISRDVPFRAISLCAYELTKQCYLKLVRPVADEAHRKLEAWEGALVGAIAGSFTAAVTNPLDVLKTRMMTGSAYGASGVPGAVRLIIAKEGAVAFVRGIVPRVVYIGPSTAIFFMVYETVKNTYNVA